ncbi:MAG: CYTH domain-containing protein [Oscillospiraceae bacterium]|nr:CYTH domain-containing protein [Oscillospiraceae bacterium]
MSKEIELKYRFSEAQIPKLLSDPWLSAFIIQPFCEIEMESTYFDTPEKHLQEKRITFRMRRENGVTVFTVKTPGTTHERGEWEVSASCTEEARPLLAAIGAPQLPDGPYTVSAQARFLRRAARISPASGLEIELSVDVGTLGPVPFCELEIELKSGTKEALEAFGAELSSRYQLTTEPLSKFARARKYTSL